MSKVTFRKADLERMIKAAARVGMKVARVEVDTGGKIALIVDNGTEVGFLGYIEDKEKTVEIVL